MLFTARARRWEAIHQDSELEQLWAEGAQGGTTLEPGKETKPTVPPYPGSFRALQTNLIILPARKGETVKGMGQKKARNK